MSEHGIPAPGIPSPGGPIPFSVLDLAAIYEGREAADALRDAATFAGHAERLGFHRYWLAEHHNMQGIASSATAVALAHVAANTRSIRVGSGGIMLPNHAPLVIAEQFGTLAALHPGRIDLGLGRAPGTDGRTLRALRRDPMAADTFPQDVLELQALLRPAQPGQAIRAVPGEGTEVPIWILGSSLFGAQLAAHLGLPYAFASHFAPDALMQAMEVYREGFRPSATLDRPYAMVAVNVVAADTEAAARFHFTTLQQSFLRLRRGTRGKIPAPDANFAMDPMEAAGVNAMLAISAVGSKPQVAAGLSRIVEATGADEIIATGYLHERAARLRSLEILSEIRQEMAPRAQAA